MDVSRDWGFAGDYVEAMWLMLQQEEPDDYVIATGKSHSVRDLLQVAFHHVGIDDWQSYVVQDERFFRPADVAVLVGDATKARTKLGWRPTVDFQQLIEMMVAADLENEKRNLGPAEDYNKSSPGVAARRPPQPGLATMVSRSLNVDV
jgi:GDPmannose 4,6-dehydratase